MTDEQFQALAPYEAILDDSLKKGRAKYPGRSVIEMFLSVIRSTNPRYKTNLNCGVCVLHLVQDAARMYFGHKKDMERTAQEKAAKETAKTEVVKNISETETVLAPEKPKRTSKKKETAE